MGVIDPARAGVQDLYAAERLAMVRLAFVVTGSREVAEEVVQEAFVRMQQRWDGIANPGGYLRTTVVNLCRRHLRRAAVERRALTLSQLSAATPDVDDTWLALARLPARQRAALALRYYEDLPEAEIAAILRCRPGTVKSTLHRALARLREELS